MAPVGVEGPSGLASETKLFWFWAATDNDDNEELDNDDEVDDNDEEKPVTGRFLGFFVRDFAFFREIAVVDFGVVVPVEDDDGASAVVGFISSQFFKPI